jgi:hypothetical protein
LLIGPSRKKIRLPLLLWQSCLSPLADPPALDIFNNFQLLQVHDESPEASNGVNNN